MHGSKNEHEICIPETKKSLEELLAFQTNINFERLRLRHCLGLHVPLCTRFNTH